jgi:CheY-like chemotaxis protein
MDLEAGLGSTAVIKLDLYRANHVSVHGDAHAVLRITRNLSMKVDEIETNTELESYELNISALNEEPKNRLSFLASNSQCGSANSSSRVVPIKQYIGDEKHLLGKAEDSSIICLKVLVVDDSLLIRKFISKVLKKISSSIVIDEADDGLPAVDLIKKSMLNKPKTNGSNDFTEDSSTLNDYDVVFIDNIMIDLHGPKAAMEMRSVGYTGLIIAVTGNVLSADVDEFLRCGANEVLYKPITEQTLRNIVGMAAKKKLIQSTSAPLPI